MAQQSDGKFERFEEKDQYVIEVYPEKNRIKYEFNGDLKSKNNIPHYVEHSAKAVAKITEGYTLLSVVTAKGAPGFSSTTPLKESLALLKSKNVSKTAVVIPKEKILQRMTLNVVSKLSGMNVKVFDDVPTAEVWLDAKD
jgi:hypothetical protein